MNKQDQELLENIEKYGWNVMKVFTNDDSPSFAFSVGIYRNFGHSEILIVGPDLEEMHRVINHVGDKIKEGKKFTENIEYDDIFERCSAKFVKVNLKHYKEYLGTAIWYYQNEDFPVLQLLWPDKNGKFPDEKSFDPELKDHQLVLNH